MAVTQKFERAGETIQIGAFTIATKDLMALEPTGDVSRTGIVVDKDKKRIVAPDPEHAGKFVAYTISVFAQREPLTEEEGDQVAAKDADIKKRKQDKLEADAKALAHEKQAAFRMGQEGIVTAVQNIDSLMTGLGAMATLFGKKQN
jgi:hypothetical protein